MIEFQSMYYDCDTRTGAHTPTRANTQWDSGTRKKAHAHRTRSRTPHTHTAHRTRSRTPHTHTLPHQTMHSVALRFHQLLEISMACVQQGTCIRYVLAAHMTCSLFPLVTHERELSQLTRTWLRHEGLSFDSQPPRKNTPTPRAPTIAARDYVKRCAKKGD